MISTSMLLAGCNAPGDPALPDSEATRRQPTTTDSTSIDSPVWLFDARSAAPQYVVLHVDVFADRERLGTSSKGFHPAEDHELRITCDQPSRFTEFLVWVSNDEQYQTEAPGADCPARFVAEIMANYTVEWALSS